MADLKLGASGKLKLAVPLLVAFAAAAVAQQPPQTAPNTSTPTLKVKTTLTVEDVTVTDAKGQPVHGLTESDFTVKEDGKPQTVKNFQEYSAQPPQQAPQAHLPPNVYTNQQATVPSAYNILFFDDVATGMGLVRVPENLMFSQQQAQKYLKAMPVGTQVAILQLATGLHIVQGFTSDRDLLLAAVDSLKAEPVHGTYVFPPPPYPPAILCLAKNTQSQMTTDALSEVASFVSGIKGRKNLIWFTPGIPWLTDYGAYRGVNCINDYTPQLDKAYSLLAAARVVVDPVDPKGLDDLAKGSDGPVDVRVSPSIRLAEKASVQDIAEATGGKAYFNRNDLDAEIGEAIASGTDYYSLSYVPPLSKSDGKHHSINVKVDRPGVHLLYRDGYVASDYAPPKPSRSDNKNLTNPPAPDSDFLAAMAHGLPDSTELLFGVSVLPSTAHAKPDDPSTSQVTGFLNPKLKGKPLVRYDIAYALPAGEITLAEAGPSGARSGSFKIAVLAYDADGEPLNSVIKSSAFTVKAGQVAEFLGQPSRLDVQVDLPPGKVFLRIGVFDFASQKTGILEIVQTVAEK